MKAYSPYLGFALGALVALPCAFLAVTAAGAGHGSYLPARLLFPFTMLSTLLYGPFTTPFILAALIQFPLYGLVLGCCHRASRLAHGLLALCATHLVAVTVVLAVPNTDFPNRSGRANNVTSAFARHRPAAAEFLRSEEFRE